MNGTLPIPDWLIVLVRQMVIEEMDNGTVRLDPVLFCPECGSRLLFPIDREPVASEWAS